MEGDAVLLRVSGHVAELTLNRDSYRNALSEEIVQGLMGFLAKLKDDETRVVVVRARGKAFCAGAKLDRVALSSDIMEVRRYQSSALDLFRAIMEFPKPTVAVVQGPALAGGAGLATACDFVIASKTAEFGYPEVNIALSPSMVMQILMRRVPWRIALEWSMLGRRVPAEQAERWGLINRSVDPEQLDAASDELIAELASKNAGALRIVKELAIVGPEMGLERAMRYAREMSTIAATTEPARSAIEGFFARSSAPKGGPQEPKPSAP